MKWLERIVSTTLVVVTGCILAILMTLFYIVATLLKVEIDPVVFGSMLAFIASCMGIGYKQFKAKRETEYAEDPETGIMYKPGTRVMKEVPTQSLPVTTPMAQIGTPLKSAKDNPPESEWEEREEGE